jgi:hypothetical protein
MWSMNIGSDKKVLMTDDAAGEEEATQQNR